MIAASAAALLGVLGLAASPAQAAPRYSEIHTVVRCNLYEANALRLHRSSEDLQFHVKWTKDNVTGRVRPDEWVASFDNPMRRVPPFFVKKKQKYGALTEISGTVETYGNRSSTAFWFNHRTLHNGALLGDHEDLGAISATWFNPGRVSLDLHYKQQIVYPWIIGKAKATKQSHCQAAAWQGKVG